MRIKEHFVLRNIADEWYVIPRQEEADRLNSIIPLNDTSAFLWQQLETEQSIDSLAEALTDNYEVDYITAKEAVISFIAELNKIGCLVPEE